MTTLTLDVSEMLGSLNIRTWNMAHAVADANERVVGAANPCTEATYLFNRVLGKTLSFTDTVFARIATKAMIREVISAKCIVDDAQLFVDEALEYAAKFCADPQWSYLWAQPDSEYTTKVVTEQVQLVDDIDIKVAIKADGKIKKGGKQPLAFEMYKVHVVEAAVPLTNQEFIALIMEKLDMSKAGATTYAYNAKKEFAPKEV